MPYSDLLELGGAGVRRTPRRPQGWASGHHHRDVRDPARAGGGRDSSRPYGGSVTRRGLSRRPLCQPLATLLLAAVALLAGCGSHGTAPALGASAHVALTARGAGQGTGGAAGTATLTPFAATRIAAYLNGKQIPYSGAATPVQLRTGGCDGPVLAALTDNAPGPASGRPSPLVRPDPSGGADVASVADEGTWVTVLDHAGDASSPILACGQPLSDRRQNFNLIEVANSRNYPLGFAQIDPIVASRVDVSLAKSPAGEVVWAIRDGGCAGGEVASGRFPAGATRGGIAFAAPDTGRWWLSVAGANGGLDACGKVGA